MTGYEIPRITGGGERPRSLIHADIYAAFQATQTTNAHTLAASYLQLANDWQAGLQVFSTSIQRSVASSWEGQAATAFVSAVNRYTTAAAELETDLRALHGRIDQSASSVSSTKYELPEPVEEKHPLHPSSWPVVGSNRDPVIEQKQEEAQSIMENKYVTPFVTNYDPQIPVLSSPVNPIVPYDIAEPTTGGKVGPDGQTTDDGSGGGGGGDSPGENLDGPTPESENPEGATTPEDTSDTEDPGSSSEQDTSDEPGTEPSTSPQSTAPASTAPVGTAGSPAAPGAPGSGAPGSGSPSGGSPAAGVPGVAGRAVPGVPGVVAPAASGAAGVSGAGAGRGMPMGGMPMGGARGGQQDEDASRTTPDYLINQANTDELIGDQPPTVANGGVIGAHLVPKDRT
ncbi:WXG100 family type VII secretion target [Nocardia sp. NPDC058705]|uniref:WXG100 family type VII secretion target n=1 Tax=Nocardia sp. NPDC058705 TaxID=3346609 RepID=UPI0036B5358C